MIRLFWFFFLYFFRVRTIGINLNDLIFVLKQIWSNRSSDSTTVLPALSLHWFLTPVEAKWSSPPGKNKSNFNKVRALSALRSLFLFLNRTSWDCLCCLARADPAMLQLPTHYVVTAVGNVVVRACNQSSFMQHFKSTLPWLDCYAPSVYSLATAETQRTQTKKSYYSTYSLYTYNCLNATTAVSTL